MNELGLGLVFEAKDLATGTMGKVSKGMLDVSGASTEAGKAIKASFAEFTTGMAMFSAGAVGLSMLAPAISEAKDFSKAIALVATEADEALFPQQQLRDVAIAIGDQFGKMPTDEAAGLYKAVALGANDAAKATFLLTAADKLAVAGNAELTTTVDALGGTLNAYGMKADQAGEVSDAFFVAMKNGNTTVQDLASSVGRVNAAAHDMGISVQEVLGAVSVMTNKGVAASEAVAGLHEALANIKHPTADAKAEAARLGIQFNETAMRTMGLQKFLASIAGSSKFAATSFTKLFTSVGGSTAISQIASDMTAFNDVMGRMRDATGATEAGFQIMSHTLSFQEDRFKALKSTALIMIGSALEPLAARAVMVGNAILEAFLKVPAPIRDFAVKLFAGVSALLVLVGGVIAAKAAFGMLAAGLAAAGVTVGGFLTILAPAVLIFGAIVLAVQAFRGAFERDVGGIATFFQNVYRKVSLAFRALTQLVEDGGFSGEVLDELDAGNEGVENFAVGIYLAVNRILNFWDGLVDGFEAGIDDATPSFQAFSTMIEGLAVSFGLVGDAIDQKDAGESFEEVGSAGARTGKALAKAAELIVNGFTAAGNAVAGFNNEAKPILADLGDIGAAFGTVGTTIAEIAVELGLADKATADSAGGWAALGHAVAYYIDAMLGPIKSLLSTSAAVMRGVISVFGGVIEILHGNVTSGVKRILYGITTLITGIISGLIQSVVSFAEMFPKLFGFDLGWSKKIGEFRKGMDVTLKEGFGLKAHEYAPGSEEARLLREENAKDSRAFIAPLTPAELAQDAPNATPYFEAPTPPLASVDAAAYASGTAMDVDGLNASIGALKAAKEGPVNVDATMVVDGDVLGKMSLKAQRSAASDGQHPVSIMFDP